MGSALLQRAGACRPPGSLERILCVLERCPAGPLCTAAGALSLHCDVSHLASYGIGYFDRCASADDARIAGAAPAADADLVCFDGVEIHQRIVHRIADAVYRMEAALAEHDGKPPFRACLRRICLQLQGQVEPGNRVQTQCGGAAHPALRTGAAIGRRLQAVVLPIVAAVVRRDIVSPPKDERRALLRTGREAAERQH